MTTPSRLLTAVRVTAALVETLPLSVATKRYRSPFSAAPALVIESVEDVTPL